MRFLSLLRDSNPDAIQLYTRGKCYRLSLMLRELYPNAEIWYCLTEGHVYTKIGKFWYDIRGVKFKVPDTCRPLDHKNSHRPHRWDNKMGKLEDKINEKCFLAVNSLKKLFVKWCESDPELLKDWEKQEFKDLQERDNQISDLISLEHTLLPDREFFDHLQFLTRDAARQLSEEGVSKVCHSLLEAMEVVKKVAEIGDHLSTELQFSDGKTLRDSVDKFIDLGFDVSGTNKKLTITVEWY